MQSRSAESQMHWSGMHRVQLISYREEMCSVAAGETTTFRFALGRAIRSRRGLGRDRLCLDRRYAARFDVERHLHSNVSAILTSSQSTRTSARCPPATGLARKSTSLPVATSYLSLNGSRTPPSRASRATPSMSLPFNSSSTSAAVQISQSTQIVS